jgi:hypothetical protein
VPPSYRLVDYSLRPAKHAERRMLCDAFRRLSKFASVESYQYVGFGSVWFSDFSLFHRQLGIVKMISIERMAAHDARFKFNKPFGGVDLKFGESGIVLPQIDWNLRTITWLDYDDPLSPGMLDDVRTVAIKSVGGSLLAVSIQCQGAPMMKVEDGDGEMRSVKTADEFKIIFGAERTPVSLSPNDLVGWNLAATCRKAILSEIDDALDVVNLSRHEQQKLQFIPIMAIEYADGAKMTTVAGVFIDKGQNSIFSSCGFEEMPFYVEPGAPAMRLEVPKLTPKEMRELEGKLPIADPSAIEAGPFPKSDAVAFAKLYRYLPSFASFEP